MKEVISSSVGRNFGKLQKSWPFLLLPFLFLLFPVMGKSQNCSVNSGVPETLCPDEPMFLYGNYSGSYVPGNTVTWSQIEGPLVNIVTPTMTIPVNPGFIFLVINHKTFCRISIFLY